jgi:hypothetical protein
MTLPKLARRLLHRDPLPPLRPTQIWKTDLTPKIELLAVNPVVAAGLHLLNDDLNTAHRLAQEQEGTTADYWHAIVHRREGDFMNSRYWYRQLGTHPVFHEMKQQYTKWDPDWFVGACSVGKEKDLEAMQILEMRLVLESLVTFPLAWSLAE